MITTDGTLFVRTPDGAIDVRAIQKRAAEDLRLDSVIVTDDIKIAIGLLATVTDELESREKQLEDVRVTHIYRSNI